MTLTLEYLEKELQHFPDSLTMEYYVRVKAQRGASIRKIQNRTE